MQLIVFNIAMSLMGKDFHRTDSPIWFFFYTLNIAVVDTVSLYMASLSSLLGDILTEAKSKIRNETERTMLEFIRASEDLIKVYSASFGPMLFIVLTYLFLCSSVGSFFMVWIINIRGNFPYKLVFMSACFTWAFRALVLLFYIAVTCDYLSTSLFKLRLTVSDHLGREQSKITEFTTQQFQLTMLHQREQDLSVSACRFYSINKTIIFTVEFQ
ncbi:hypothetical protein DMENIID0001_114030 [Sergentomyia squamirostris]